MSVPLSDTRLAEIRERARRMIADHVTYASVQYAEDYGLLLAEVDRLRAENAGLDDLRLRAIDKNDQIRDELRDRRTEDLNLRGLLAPNGLPRRVPTDLGASLVPAVEWLVAELAKYVSHEPTIAEEWTYLRSECQRVETENEQLRTQVAEMRGWITEAAQICRDHDASPVKRLAELTEMFNG